MSVTSAVSTLINRDSPGTFDGTACQTVPVKIVIFQMRSISGVCLLLFRAYGVESCLGMYAVPLTTATNAPVLLLGVAALKSGSVSESTYQSDAKGFLSFTCQIKISSHVFVTFQGLNLPANEKGVFTAIPLRYQEFRSWMSKIQTPPPPLPLKQDLPFYLIAPFEDIDVIPQAEQIWAFPCPAAVPKLLAAGAVWILHRRGRATTHRLTHCHLQMYH